ncbi:MULTISPECIES: hypothetical protein [Paenibacillus]|uniref:hypothetical protein n=1 Tax=Paenibacillus TaxID=44249 RepID=UPI00020D7106|nr:MULTISPECIES: hypothetical protein [Paenibacillus]EGL16352.1 hypothetical protein HMPREF9413_2179 [Paenibacillus sp. HGF7]EPD88925.1 hypothetical protein HMPREF1207_01876 [Paenibacillus sp. HGH0039]MBV6717347.1 hypothetical protein [Paenibacillus chitinolyticus]
MGTIGTFIRGHWIPIVMILGCLFAIYFVYSKRNELQLYWLNKREARKRKS